MLASINVQWLVCRVRDVEILRTVVISDLVFRATDSDAEEWLPLTCRLDDEITVWASHSAEAPLGGESHACAREWLVAVGVNDPATHLWRA
jgi:hypothetical protein